MTQDAASHWRNRIVGYDDVDPEQLLANPRNWRIHPQQQQDALSTVLDNVGWVDDVLVNKRTGFVIDGHLRVALALRKGETSIPVKYVDLNESEEMQVLATLDPIAGMAETDKAKLEEAMSAIETDDESMRVLLDSIAQEQGIFEGAGAGSPFGGAGAGPDGSDGYVTFVFGDHSGRVSQAVYQSFVAEYSKQKKAAGSPLLDDVLKAWLDV